MFVVHLEVLEMIWVLQVAWREETSAAVLWRSHAFADWPQICLFMTSGLHVTPNPSSALDGISNRSVDRSLLKHI